MSSNLVKSCVGSCASAVPRESGSKIQQVSLSVTVEGHSTATSATGGGTPIITTTTSTAEFSEVFQRIPFRRSLQEVSPEENEFYLVQTSCCCPCRSLFIQAAAEFAALPGRILAGGFLCDLSVKYVTQSTGNPEATSYYGLPVTVALWPYSAVPCRKSLEGLEEPAAIAVSGMLQISPGSFGDAPLYSASNGTFTPDEPGSGRLTGIKPCDTEQQYVMSYSDSYSYTDEGENYEASVITVVSLSFSEEIP